MVCGLLAFALAATPARADDDGDDGPGGGAAASGGPSGGGGEGLGQPTINRGTGNFFADVATFSRAVGSIFSGRAATPREELAAIGLDAAARARLVAGGFTIQAERQGGLVPGGTARLLAPPGLNRAAALARARQLAPGTAIDRNDRYTMQAGDCSGNRCFHLRQVGLAAAPASCRVPLRIGMVDTAVALDHAALEGARIRLETVRGPGRAPSGKLHGTAVAALLVGRADGPLPGLLPQAELVAIDAFHRTGGSDAADAFDIAGAIDRLAALHVGVINLSFAGPANQVLEAVTRAASARGIVLAAASGNAGPRAAPRYPAAYPWVVAVTAVDQESRAYVRAVQGTHVAFAAPGVGLPAPSGSRALSGTSYAVPFVTAAYALALPGRAPEAATRRLVAAAQDLGAPGRDPVFGHGLIRLGAACDG
jgi:hypothetical protein